MGLRQRYHRRLGRSGHPLLWALSIDPTFVNSYVGIGSNHLAQGNTDQARASFGKLSAVARNTGERRLARFWTAASYVQDGNIDTAIAELEAGYALAEAEHDAGTMSGDLVQIGDVLREANRLDEALAKYKDAVAMVESSPLPDPVKAPGGRPLSPFRPLLPSSSLTIIRRQADSVDLVSVIAGQGPLQAAFSATPRRNRDGTLLAAAECTRTPAHNRCRRTFRFQSPCVDADRHASTGSNGDDGRHSRN